MESSSSAAAANNHHVISHQNRRQALEILHHDPLHISQHHHEENDNDCDENNERSGEVVSLLLSTNDLHYVNVVYGNNKRSSSSVCGGYCRQYKWRIFGTLLLLGIGMIVLAVATRTDSFPTTVRLPTSIPKHHDAIEKNDEDDTNINGDMCLQRYNQSLAELMQIVSSFIDPRDWCGLRENDYNDDDDECRCASTMEPSRPSWNSQPKLDLWQRTLERNIQLIEQQNQEQEDVLYYDVVLYGDSITEHFMGTELSTRWQQWQGNKAVFDETFQDMAAVPLGIAGDTTAQLLYRFENGELPDSLHAKVYWMLIGTNDLSAGCSVEAVVAGTIRVVEKLQQHVSEQQQQQQQQQQQMSTTIVLNSILPRGARPGQDLSDSLLWHNVRRVNQWLECYANSTPNVEFFNATSLFVVSSDTVVHQVKDYFYDDVHPSEQGSKGWAKAIKQRVQELIR